jgi:hypothetical protein
MWLPTMVHSGTTQQTGPTCELCEGLSILHTQLIVQL